LAILKASFQTDTGFGIVSLNNGKPALNVVYGKISVKNFNVSGKTVKGAVS